MAMERCQAGSGKRYLILNSGFKYHSLTKYIYRLMIYRVIVAALQNKSRFMFYNETASYILTGGN